MSELKHNRVSESKQNGREPRDTRQFGWSNDAVTCRAALMATSVVQQLLPELIEIVLTYVVRSMLQWRDDVTNIEASPGSQVHTPFQKRLAMSAVRIPPHGLSLPVGLLPSFCQFHVFVDHPSSGNGYDLECPYLETVDSKGRIGRRRFRHVLNPESKWMRRLFLITITVDLSRSDACLDVYLNQHRFRPLIRCNELDRLRIVAYGWMTNGTTFYSEQKKLRVQ